MKILYYDFFYGMDEESNLKALIDLGVPMDYIEQELSKVNGTGTHSSTKNSLTFEKALSRVRESGLNDNIKCMVTGIIDKMSRACCRLKEKNMTTCIDSLSETDLFYYIRAAICIDFINPEKIIGSRVETGYGIRKSEEGTFSIPSPLIMELLTNIPLKSDFSDMEGVSALGAATIAGLINEFNDKKEFIVKKIGYGTSKWAGNDLKPLRIILAEAENSADEAAAEEYSTGCLYDRQYILECNIDDMNPEIFDFVMVKLFKAGAADAYFTPIMMKKGRPAIKISVLCSEDRIKSMEEILFMETTTFGIRRYEVEKTMLKRSFSKIETKYGQMTVKRGFYKGEQIKAKPEYDECRKKAEELGIPASEIYREMWRNI